MSWVAIRSALLHRIICEIEPALGLVRVREHGRTDIVELEPYGIQVVVLTATTESTK